VQASRHLILGALLTLATAAHAQCPAGRHRKAPLRGTPAPAGPSSTPEDDRAAASSPPPPRPLRARGTKTYGPLVAERGETARQRLRIHWEYPVAPSRSQPLERAAVLRLVRGDDPRPLLVARECAHCEGTDAALLDTANDNEKTVLLTRWFRCVKLPKHVVEPAHAFSEVFTGAPSPHLLLVDNAGECTAFSGWQEQAELWEAMHDVLRREYQRDAKVAIQRLRNVLASYDKIDADEREVTALLDRSEEMQGDLSPRAKELRAQLDRILPRRRAAEVEEERASDLGLRAAPNARPWLVALRRR
jgi:hypothetical protein